MLLPICNKFVSLFVCSLLPSATLLCNGSPITPSFPRLSLRYQRWSLSSAMRFVMFSLLSPCGYHPLWHQKTPFSKSYRFAKKKHRIFQKKHKWTKKNCRRIRINVEILDSIILWNHVEIDFHVAILTHWGHTGLVEHQHLVGEETWEAKFGDRNLIEIQ